MSAADSQFLFPGMQADAPPAELSKWEQVKEIAELSKKHGQLLPQMFAAPILGVSEERVHALVGQKRFRTWRFLNKTWLCEDDLVSFAQSERKTGRPRKDPSKKEVFKSLHKAIKAEVVKKH